MGLRASSTARFTAGHEVHGYAYVGRKLKKREYRKLWIARINAGARICGTNYSRLINGLKVAGIDVNRKVLADLAVNDMNAFRELVDTAMKAIA